MRLFLASVSAIALVACSGPAAAPAETADAAPVEATPTAAPAEAPAVDVKYGKAATYTLDPNHASLTWRVKHFGLSNYTARFTKFDATLQFNPDDASATSLTATIDPTSVETDYPGDFKAGHPDSPYNTFDEEIGNSPDYFNAGAFPQITFTSTEITKTGHPEPRRLWPDSWRRLCRRRSRNRDRSRVRRSRRSGRIGNQPTSCPPPIHHATQRSRSPFTGRSRFSSSS